MRVRLAAAMALTLLAGCTKGRDPYPNAPVDAAVRPVDAAPLTVVDRGLQAAGSPSAAGAPKAPGDFEKLSKAAEQGTPVKQAGAPPIERLDAHRVRVGKVLVDRTRGRLEVPGRVNMTEGILEYFAVSTNGKLHESVLEVFAEPSHIHLGLILMGLETARWDRSDPMKPPKLLARGGELRVFVEFTDPKTGKPARLPAETWLYNRQKRASPPPLAWFFHGSTFWNGRYTADSDRSLLALIPDETAVIMTDGEFGNPYQGDGLGFEVHTAVIPPKDTALVMTLEKHTLVPDAKGRTLPGSKLPMVAPRPIATPLKSTAPPAK